VTSIDGPARPELGALETWIGTWEGEGQGCWEAPQPFRYHEIVAFRSSNKPYLAYLQRTWIETDQGSTPMHAESGYLRAVPDGTVEWVIAQPTGFVEIHRGRPADDEIAFEPLHVARTPTALDVRTIQRTVALSEDTFRYRLRIAMGSEPLADHLVGTLHRS
jgi:hypothetical protein